jgi:putative tryptophan/tyrosine transport system substrate-binding protein
MASHIGRRKFLATLGGTVIAWPLAPRQAHAAPPGRSVTIGVIAPLSFPALEGLRKGFRELGYVEGRNLQLEYRWAEGSTDRYFSIAQELVRLGVDAIVTWGTPATMGAQQATATLPIVMGAVGDPLAAQLRVSNVSRPGGNITGFSSLANELEVKRLQVLKELLPKLQRLAVLSNAANPAIGVGAGALQQAARSSGVTIEIVQLQGNDFDKAFAELRQTRPDAVLVLADPVLLDLERSQLREFDCIERYRGYCSRSRIDASPAAGARAQGFGARFYRNYSRALQWTSRPGRCSSVPIQKPDRGLCYPHATSSRVSVSRIH